MLAAATAQLSWVRSVIADLRTGRLAWSQDELRELAGRSAAESAGQDSGAMPV